MGTSLTVTNINIGGNTVTSYDGGGLVLGGDAATTVTISDGSVYSNTARNGAGIYITGGPSVVASGVDIYDNQASAGGGGITVLTGCAFDLTKSFIRGNEAGAYGAGLNNAGTATLTNCIVSGNSVDVQSYSDGGGINSNAGTLNVYSSTISGNYAKRNGGGVRGSATSTLINSIVWGNTAGSSGANIYDTATTVTYSDVQGGYTGVGNIDGNPRFVDFQQAGQGSTTSGGDFRLCNGVDDPVAGCTDVSSCIDVASATSAPADDIEGDSRPHDVDGLGDDVDDYDMGADEYSP